MFEGIHDPRKGSSTDSSDGAMQRPSWPHPTHRAGAVTPRKPNCSSLLNGEVSDNLFSIAIKKLKFKLKERKPPGKIIFCIGGPQF